MILSSSLLLAHARTQVMRFAGPLTGHQRAYTYSRRHSLPVMGTNRLLPFSARGALSGVGPASRVSGRGVVCEPSCGFFSVLQTYYGGNSMAETAPCRPSRADGSGSIAVATYNIRNGHNGGLESALRVMEGIGADLGILMETKVTDGIHTRNWSGYSVVASNTPSTHQGGIALFW
jgi:hypothetical protein